MLWGSKTSKVVTRRSWVQFPGEERHSGWGLHAPPHVCVPLGESVSPSSAPDQALREIWIWSSEKKDVLNAGSQYHRA